MQEGKIFWIIGFGRYGKLALERLAEAFPKASFTIVDKGNVELGRPYRQEIEVISCDGATFLARSLTRKLENVPSYIIPTVPLHLAFDWVKVKLKKYCKVEKVPIPKKVFDYLPNPQKGSVGRLYASFAKWICPDTCKGGEEICIIEGKRRENLLFDIVKNIRIEGYHNLCVRSIQLLPGVGGYKPETLWDILDEIHKKGTERNYMLSTACSCHGVIDFFRCYPLKSVQKDFSHEVDML